MSLFGTIRNWGSHFEFVISNKFKVTDGRAMAVF